MHRTKVAIVKCEGYGERQVSSAVSGLFKLLGGIERFVKQNDRVLLKPNLLTGKPPEAGVTTHPNVVAAIANEVIGAGATPIIGDSPGGIIRDVTAIWKITGMEEISRQLNIELINLDAQGVVEKDTNGRKYYVSKSVFEVDVIINLPKIKTHELTGLTGAVKNMFGIIPGFRKAEYHKIAPHPVLFSSILLDIHAIARPTLTIVDGIVSMDGSGPVDGRLRNSNILLGGTDDFAVDTVITKIIGCRVEDIPTLRLAKAQRKGVTSVDDIEVIGIPIEQAYIPDFKLPKRSIESYVPSVIVRTLRGLIWVRPYIIEEKCKACATCVENCPVNAIKMNKHPTVDYSKCISCFCCRELCPAGSIELKRSPLLRILR